MARITVEDCIDKVSSRFELILIASQRARKLHTGDQPSLKKENDKNTVIALREIEEETISLDQLKEVIIKEYQNVSFSENEDENEDENASKNIFTDQNKIEETSISPAEEEKLEEHYILEDSNQVESSENSVSDSNEDQEKNI